MTPQITVPRVPSTQTATEGLLEPSGWISRGDVNRVLPAWHVEVPPTAVPGWLRERAAQYVEEAREVWGLPPIEVRWYRTTCDRAVSDAQWARTRAAFLRAGIGRKPQVHLDTTDLNGYALGHVTEEMAAAYPGEVRKYGSEESQALGMYHDDSGPDEIDDNENVIYLSGDPYAFEGPPSAALDVLVAHELLHRVQYECGYPIEDHERLAYQVNKQWRQLRMGYRLMAPPERQEVHCLLRTAPYYQNCLKAFKALRQVADGTDRRRPGRVPQAPTIQQRPRLAPRPPQGRLPRHARGQGRQRR